MCPCDGDTTSPAFLGRLVDWRDDEAWSEFVRRYDPLIRRACRRFRLDAEAHEDLCQQVWIELAHRLQTFRYDPGRTFRGWLRQLCRSRAIDLLRKRRVEAMSPLDGEPASARMTDDEAEPTRSPLLLQAERIQGSVRDRVDGRTWDVFWRVAVEGASIREAAEAAGMSYAAAFAAQKRVGQMLRAEGRRLASQGAAGAPGLEPSRP